MLTNASKHILIAPLDWGLGHTTRCVPIMRYLLSRGHSVTFAGNEWQRRYINESFKGIETIHLEGYDVTYSKRGSAFMFNLFAQVPGLLRTIREEHDWLQLLVRERSIDAVISDNRYGLFHDMLPCVMMTHQLQAQTGLGTAADNLLRRLHYKYIRRFHKCWVVDVPGTPNLSGKLAHPHVIPENAEYIGLLSQLEEENILQAAEEHLLVLLSGPEPQRTILAAKLWAQVLHYSGKVIFVEGSNKVKRPEIIPSHVIWHGQITKDTLLPLMLNAKIVVCRSGYSTIMDLATLHKKAILIPTPGQTEQEYLGKYLHAEGMYYTMSQKKFELQKALEATAAFPFNTLSFPGGDTLYKKIMNEWLLSL